MKSLKLQRKFASFLQCKSTPTFPPEVWTLIFEHLSFPDLSQARLTCRRWNQLIVGSPSLLVKFELQLLEKTLGPESDPIKDLLAPSTIRFSRVLFHGNTFVEIGTWWPQIGRNLQVLEMWNRKIAIADLLELLRGTPRLKILKFCSKHNTGGESWPEIDFALDSLEVLEIRLNYQRNVLHIFKQLCPRLRQLTLDLPNRPDLEISSSDVVDFVRTLNDSLEGVSVCGTIGTLLEELLNVEGLRLKQVTVMSRCPEMLKILGKVQPSVNKLNSCLDSDQALCEVGKHLPNLKSISNRFCENQPTTVTFLTSMQNLTSLRLNCSQGPNLDGRLTFASSHHCELKTLSLLNAKQTLRWIEHFPSLRTLELRSCSVESWRWRTEECSLTIVDLELHYCEIPNDALLTLLSSCQNLAKLKLGQMQTVDDATVREICKLATRLQSLRFNYCFDITDTAVEYICQHCQGLDEVVIHQCRNISRHVVDKLKAARVRKVQWDPMEFYC